MVDYYKYAQEFENIYKDIRLHSNIDTTIEGIFMERGYVDNRMSKTLRELGVFKIDEFELQDYRYSIDRLDKFGLLNKNKDFLLERGYTIPIRDIEGNLLALVAYYPGQPTAYKYRTTPSKYFYKKYAFFNLDHVVKNFGFEWVILVEGMFDAIALRSVGLPAVATMGSELSAVKKEILKQFKKVVIVPDFDSIGSKEFVSWDLDGNITFLKFVGNKTVVIDGEEYPFKDCDDFVKYFDVEETFYNLRDTNEKVVKIEI